MNRRVFIVSHDAGGAEVVSAWALKHKGRNWMRFCVQGPAQRIVQRDHGDFEPGSLDEIQTMRGDDLVLTATSLEANLERRAIALAKKRGVPCATFLDHWDLYRDRFDQRNGLEAGLPDEVWVGDEYAWELALREGFPKERLRLVPNPYFERMAEQGRELSQEPAPPGRKVLYFGEPISRKFAVSFGAEAALYDDELVLMRNFLASASRHAGRFDQITLRLHPSEPTDKYRSVIEQCARGMPVRLSENTELTTDITAHQVIVGIDTMGLVIALLMGKSAVYSCITGKPWQTTLPHREIRRINCFDHIFDHIS